MHGQVWADVNRPSQKSASISNMPDYHKIQNDHIMPVQVWSDLTKSDDQKFKKKSHKKKHGKQSNN